MSLLLQKKNIILNFIKHVFHTYTVLTEHCIPNDIMLMDVIYYYDICNFNSHGLTVDTITWQE